MIAVRIVAISVALAVAASSPATAAADAALERALFRTLTLNFDTAPRDTIAAATRCALPAARMLPSPAQEKIVEIDRRPVYSFNDRLRELVQVLTPLDDAVAQPFVLCFTRLGAGEFGPIKGSGPATAAANPTDLAVCPAYTDRVGTELICFCPPLLGGSAYGYKTYSDDSSICLAARHSGVHDYLTGGIVRAAFRPGCAAYESVTANGYPSGSSGRSARSFHFPSVGEGTCPK